MSSYQGRKTSTGPKAIPGSPQAKGDDRDSRSRATSTARLASPVPSSMMSPIPRIPTPPPEFQTDFHSPLAGAAAGSPNRGPGHSALASAIAGYYPKSPPRQGTPHARAPSPGISSPVPVTDLSRRGSDAARDRRESDTVLGHEDAEIVARHLVQQLEDSKRERSSVSRGRQPPAHSEPEDEEFSSLQLQGGDITREIYRWAKHAQNEGSVQRSKSFSVSRAKTEAASLRLPGAMRREYLQRAQSPAMSAVGSATFAESGTPHPPRTSNFLQFLTLYGHFAGEELEEEDENTIEDDHEDEGETERSPLLQRPAMRRRGTSKRDRTKDKQSSFSATMMLMKSFVGTGILFLPRAFANGGMLFSSLVLVGVAGLSYYCFLLLINTRSRIDGSFGELGGMLYGKWLRNLILGSLVLSQIGFVSAYIVFTAENLRAFAFAVSNCSADVALKFLILAQLVVFLPMSLLRDISKLSSTALIADAFIIIGIVYLAGSDIKIMVDQGGISPSVTLFNPSTWTLFIGTAVFTFEGIALIVPIQESMKRPQDFPRILFVVMVIVTVLFTGMGALSYATFGADTKTVVLLNLPQDKKLVNAVQFLYSIAILLSTPLQLFPAVRILENSLFTRSGKANNKIKWYKNFFRFLLVIICALIAWVGADDLDKFVSLVGSFACIPLVYIYPPLLHYRGVGGSRLRKGSDLLVFLFGITVMVYTSVQTIFSWANSAGSPGSGGAEDPPDFCKT